MKITIESTDMLTDVRGCRCRVWRGVTEAGAKCDLAIALIRAPLEEKAEEFQRELATLSDPDESLMVSMRQVW